MDYQKIRNRVKEVMEENNDTKASLARKLGINRSTICRWFSDNGENSIRSDTLLDISYLYKVNISWLLGESDRKEVEDFGHCKLRAEIDEYMKDCSTEDLEKVLAMVKLFVKK